MYRSKIWTSIFQLKRSLNAEIPLVNPFINNSFPSLKQKRHFKRLPLTSKIPEVYSTNSHTFAILRLFTTTSTSFRSAVYPAARGTEKRPDVLVPTTGTIPKRRARSLYSSYISPPELPVVIIRGNLYVEESWKFIWEFWFLFSCLNNRYTVSWFYTPSASIF